GGGLAGGNTGAVDRGDALERGVEAETVGDLPAVAQTGGGLGLTAVDGVLHAVFAEEMGVAQILGLHADEGAVVLLRLVDLEGTAERGDELVAGVETGLVVGLPGAATGDHALVGLHDVLLVFGEDGGARMVGHGRVGANAQAAHGDVGRGGEAAGGIGGRDGL